MIHVAIHLPEEALLGGPYSILVDVSFEVQKKLKNYVRNKAKPEGSIAEGYVAEEALTFCSRYLKDDVETRFNRLGRNDDGLPEEEPNKFQVFRSACKLTGRMKETRLTTDVRQAVVWFVLNNSPEVDTDILAYREGRSLVSSAVYYEVAPQVVFHCVVVILGVLQYTFIYETKHSKSGLGLPSIVALGKQSSTFPLLASGKKFQRCIKRIFSLLLSYFDLASWYNNQDKVVMGNNVYTVGDRVKLGLQLKLRILWRKNKQRIKADHFTRYGSAEEARNHLPPKKVWGDRTEDEWNNLVDWWSHPDRVARSLQNAANRAKNTILTHQGKKSFAQGRNEYKVQKGHYEDLIETWRKTHSRPETGEFKTQKNLKRYLDMKSMQDQVRAGVIPYKTDQDILDEVVPSTNRQNMSGKGRKLPGGGSTSRRRGPQAFPDVISREEMDRILRQRDQEAELLRKQTAEAQQRAYLAALKADAAYQNSETMYGAIGEYFSNYAPNPTRPFMPPAFARPTMPQLSPEWAHLLNPPFPYNQPLQPSYAGPSQYTGPPGYTGPPRYTAPLQPLQPPYVGQFPFTPVNNNTFNNCYNPVMNSNLASTSNSRPELPRFIINPHNNDTRSVDELARDRELAGEDNDVGDNEEADSQQSSGDYSEDEEGDNEEVQDESEESD
ncbi:acidic leucine-rich nuclear phosphoprotein 32 family member A [Tanacetum coccineum]